MNEGFFQIARHLPPPSPPRRSAIKQRQGNSEALFFSSLLPSTHTHRPNQPQNVCAALTKFKECVPLHGCGSSVGPAGRRRGRARGERRRNVSQVETD